MSGSAICFGALSIGVGGYLVSIKEDQPNYKLYRNGGIFFLVVGALMFIGGLIAFYMDVSESMAANARARASATVYAGGGGGVNAVMPPVNNGGRNTRVYSTANSMQNAQYGANRAMLQAQAGNRMQYWQGH